MLLDTRFNKLTERVIGCAMRVHTELGSGFPELIYQRALAVELKQESINYQGEIHLPVFYKETAIGSRRADFLIETHLLVELKALSELAPLNHAQVINYLKAYQLEVALLINFGAASLQFKRFVRNKTR
ncbi:GxxExxY protein [Hymenobacter sp. UV11]|uniref:GxxExxY protein n=1 Tax=Hymenobacter sp. UV11 TaxID=1849735 RepID=UPI00105E566D|nr:GxxExxY protein [Hymenobacter sp. UV11]TDN37361.1 GxxExxY protein [Hymenobacter sp. UV11]TFZ68548.1 GxxExxY protein [Hymenobacter sp. UV11]